VVSGAFAEYTYSPSEKFDAILGLRQDYNSYMVGLQRHASIYVMHRFREQRFELAQGRGQRTANIFAENTAVLASSRKLVIQSPNIYDKKHGLQPEVSWNSGIAIDQSMRIFGREASASVEFFQQLLRSWSITKIPERSNFTIWTGKSFSNSLQTEFRFMPAPHFETRLAYRLLDVQTDFSKWQKDQTAISQTPWFCKPSL
jgi:hypothetical protein